MLDADRLRAAPTKSFAVQSARGNAPGVGLTLALLRHSCAAPRRAPGWEGSETLARR